MTANEMITWLKGYFTGRESLSKEDIDFLSAKLEEVKPDWMFDPNMFKVHPDPMPFRHVQPVSIPGAKADPYHVGDPPGTAQSWTISSTGRVHINGLPDNHVPGTCGPTAPGPALEKRYVDRGVEG